VIIENVPGVRSDKSGVVQVAKWLFESEGYTVETGVLKASAMGWPQTRKRFFMVASKTNTPIPLSAVGDALAVDPTNALNIEWAIGDHEKTPKDNHMFRQAERSPDNKRRINYLFDNNLYDLPDSERPACHRDKAHSYPTIYGRLRPDEPAPTLTTGFMTNGRGRYTHPTQRRTLNPAEAARIQGFPDDYVFDPDGRRPHNCELLKWIGDAVPMPLGYAVALSALGTRLHNFRPATSTYSGWGSYKKHPC
jgi:DNA (cytosine-5)-methyltransferase 1